MPEPENTLMSSGPEPLFNMTEADRQDGVLTLEIDKRFIETVAWALKHCPESRRNKRAAGVLASQMMKVAAFLYGEKPLDELVDMNGRELVEFVIHSDGSEQEFRKTG